MFSKLGSEVFEGDTRGFDMHLFRRPQALRVDHPQAVYILAVSTVMTGLVGVSRVALGVHGATDVMEGWAFGAAWVMLWLLLGGRFTRPGTS